MTILQIGVLIALAVIAGHLPKGRQLAMLGISAFAVFWLQPAEPFLSLMFWLPVATLAIAVLTWAITAPAQVRAWRENWPAIAVLAGVAVLMDLNRYLRLGQIYTVGTPAPAWALGVLLAIGMAAWLLTKAEKARPVWGSLLILGIIAIFIVLKSPVLVHALTAGLAKLHGASASEAVVPFAWLGFSYLSFRLMHTIRDRQAGLLPPVTLIEFMNYALFFPAFTAGPIDRAERFLRDLRDPCRLEAEDWTYAGTRVAMGLFKKFVLADQLAVISINDVLVSYVHNGAWLWLFLYAYTFRIYLDFSGYTDIAIGMGRLLGVQLPENFASPYLKPNLAQFWNSWHMSLTQWFRSYFFNPVTRTLRSAKAHLPVWLIVLVTQVSTMVLIGLWHGVTWGFVAWGLWHGIGLFLQNRWSELAKRSMPAWALHPRWRAVIAGLGTILTFNFVALGWLFFTLSTPAVAWLALRKLFGLA